MNDITNSNKLFTIREMERLSQKEFSERLGVKQSYYSELERGKRELTAKIISSLIKEFNVSSDWLIADVGEMHITNSNILFDKSDNETPPIFNKKNLLNDNVSNKNISPKIGGYSEEKNMLNVNVSNKNISPKMGGYFGGAMGGIEENNSTNDLSRALIWTLCSSYNKKNKTDFAYNSFSELSSMFTIIANYADFLQTMLESEVVKEVFDTAKMNFTESGATEAIMPEELDAILDKYVKIYSILEESAVKGSSVVNDLNGLIEMLRNKHNIFK